MIEAETTNTIDQRRAGRLADTDLQCTLGTIQNISANGMVVLCQGAVPSRAAVLIGHGEDYISVHVRRIWIKRIGFRKRLAAYRFIDPPENMLGLISGAKLPNNIKRVL